MTLNSELRIYFHLAMRTVYNDCPVDCPIEFTTLNCINQHYNGISNHQRLDCLLNHLFRQIKENIKAPCHWSLWGESTGDWWIPLTKGQWHRICFHFMTNCIYQFYTYVPVNSLAPGKFEWNFRHVIFKQVLVIEGWGISCEIAPIWMSLDFTDDQSTLFQVMAWCRQARSHYLSQCWPRSLSPYGVTRPQWV